MGPRRSQTVKNDALVILVEDDSDTRKLIQDFLLDLGCEVLPFASGKDAWEHLDSGPPPDCLLLDIRLQDMDGREIFRRAQRRHPSLPVILMTAFGNTREGVEAMKEGAHYYFTKPVDFLLLRRTVGELLEKRRLQRELERLRDGARDRYGLVGETPSMRRALERIEMVADHPTTVLITGETGTGKELVAHAIHRASGRRDRPFVVVNCAAVPESLLESELFGYERGAFTGAARSKPGKLEKAHRGTLFLDEVGDMPLALQGKLLRVLEDKVVERLGALEGREVDVRFLAATNRNLPETVASGEFRHDLYYRLNLFEIPLPPLRDRQDDIPLLALHFVRELSPRYQREVRSIEPRALEALRAFDWPGNVRELKNVIESALICGLRDGPPQETLPATAGLGARPSRKQAEIPR